MASNTVLKIVSPESAAQMLSLLSTEQGSQAALQSTTNYLEGVNGGEFRATIYEYVGAVAATATLTSTGAATATETFILCNVTFTARASGATGNEFNVSGTVATQATNIANAINGSSNLTGIVTAAAVAGVVTISAYIPGIAGNGLQISEGLTNVSLATFSGLATGSNGTAVTIDCS